MKNNVLSQIIVTVLFVLMLFVPFGIEKVNEWTDVELSNNREDVLNRYGFFLNDATEQVGLDFKHQRATVDDELSHILPQISSVGASVTISDVNKDGFSDIYLTSSEFGSQNALFLNMGDGTLTEAAEEFGIAAMSSEEVGAAMGSVWGDINNDGYEDLFIFRWGKPELFLNIGGTGFTNITDNSGLPDHVNANTALWIDYNRDGLLDLFIGGYYHEDVDLFNLEDTRMMPDSYEYATNGGLNYLFENKGDGIFEDVSEKTGIQETRKWTLASSSADINESGYPDLVLANDYGVDEVLINQNGERFINIGEDAGPGFTPKSGMSVDFGDILNQGNYSIYITNISEAGVLMQGNNLWVPARTSGSGTELSFRNLAGNMGVEIGEWGYSGKFIDFNSDGYLDIYVANGYVSDEPETDYWYDYARVVGGNRNIIIDAKNWPAMNNRTFSGYQTNKIWLNDGAGRFREVSGSVGGALALDSRSISEIDLLKNGALDFVVANQNQHAVFFQNTLAEETNWVGFELEGTKSNRSAIGASIKLYWGDGNITKKRVSGGEAFSSQGQRAVHFGVGNFTEVEKAEIQWPSGAFQVIESPEINRYHSIKETSD
jgi:hypothetical protein